MTLEQRVDFHKSLDHMLKAELTGEQYALLGELKQAIYDMCRCWPCSLHETLPAVYLGCEFCHVCALHSHSTDVFAGKR